MKKIVLLIIIPFLFCKPAKSQFALDFVVFFAQIVSTADEGGYEYKQTLFKNKPADLHNFRFAWAPGNKFAIGMCASFGNNRITPWYNNEVHNLFMGNGSIYGEYHFRKKEKFYNCSGIVSVGRGYSSINGNNIPINSPTSTSYWIIEPGINFNVCVFKFLRFNAGLSYRVISGSRLYGQNDESLSGPCLNLGINLTSRRF